VMGTRARLIPMLRAIRSISSSSFVGNNALMKVYPGSSKTKMDPSRYLAYTIREAFSDMVNTVAVVAGLL